MSTEAQKYNAVITLLKEKATQVLPPGSMMALYGSRARGDNRPDSDWDIIILIPGDEEPDYTLEKSIFSTIYLAGIDIDEFFTPRIYTFKGWEKRSFLPFHKNVEKDKIIIYQN